jgi:hypothetical protein
MALSIPSNIRTLGEVLNAMAPFAGGSVPDENDQEFTDWKNWVINKQEEYARRAFWRRCLTREVFQISGETTVLPDRFNRPNALFMLVVEGVDWKENPNSDEQNIFVEMINDPEDDDFGKWQMRFLKPVTTPVDAILWYYANPPKPVALTDVLLLPGDMIAYAALAEYFRTTGAEGSQDKAEEDAENRFNEYLSIEVIPDKSELLTFASANTKVDYLKRAKGYYTSRRNRSYQS